MIFIILPTTNRNDIFAILGILLEIAGFLVSAFRELADGNAAFTGTQFKEAGSANFYKAHFDGNTNFERAHFYGNASFLSAEFKEEHLVEFSETQFSREASFRLSHFKGKADFSQTKFLAEVYFLENKFAGNTIFRNVFFEHPNKVTFDDSNLSNVSFADTDITKIKFADNIEWRGGKKGFGIIEEEWLEHKAKGEKCRSCYYCCRCCFCSFPYSFILTTKGCES